MTSRKVWRYYCDHCRKGGCNKAAMATHEKHCTANPERVCRMCSLIEGYHKPMAELIMAIDGSLPDCGLQNLRDLASNCPVCIFAAIRQSGFNNREYEPEANIAPKYIQFDFKKEMEERMVEVRAAREEERREWAAVVGYGN